MSTLNANPDASDTSGSHADGLYAAMSPENDMSASSPNSTQGEVMVSHFGDGLRCSVRNHPLTAVATAAALGMLLARWSR